MCEDTPESIVCLSCDHSLCLACTAKLLIVIQQDEQGINQEGLDFSEIVCVQCHTVTALSEDVQYNIIEFLKENNLLVTENGIEDDEEEQHREGIVGQGPEQIGGVGESLGEQYEDEEEENEGNLGHEIDSGIEEGEESNLKHDGQQDRGKSIILEEIEGEEMTGGGLTQGTNQCSENSKQFREGQDIRSNQQNNSSFGNQNFAQPNHEREQESGISQSEGNEMIQNKDKHFEQNYNQANEDHDDENPNSQDFHDDIDEERQALGDDENQIRMETEEEMINQDELEENSLGHETDYTNDQMTYDYTSGRNEDNQRSQNLELIFKNKQGSMVCPKHRHKSEKFSLYDLDQKILLCSECVVEAKLRPFPTQNQKQRLKLLKHCEADVIDDFHERLALLQDLEEGVQVRRAELGLKERELKRRERVLSKALRFQINEVKGLVDTLVDEVCQEKGETIMDWGISAGSGFTQSSSLSKIENGNLPKGRKAKKIQDPLLSHRKKLKGKMEQLKNIKRRIWSKTTEPQRFADYLNTNCYSQWGFDKKIEEISSFLETRNTGRPQYGLKTHISKAKDEKDLIFYGLLNKLIQNLEIKRDTLFPDKIEDSKIISTPIKPHHQSEIRHHVSSLNYPNVSFNPNESRNLNQQLLATSDPMVPKSHVRRSKPKDLHSILGMSGPHKFQTRQEPFLKHQHRQNMIPKASHMMHGQHRPVSYHYPQQSQLPSERSHLGVSHNFKPQASFATRLEQLKRENEISKNNISIVQKNNYNILFSQNKKMHSRNNTDWKSLLESIKREKTDFTKQSLKENKFDFSKQKKESKFTKIFSKMKAEHRSRNTNTSHFKFLN